jgi:CRISPR-associated protein Csm2
MVNYTQNRQDGGRSGQSYGQGGNRPQSYGQGGGRPGQYGQQSRNMTFDELATEVRKVFFGNGLYDEILKIKNTDKLDALLEETERFVKELGTQVTTSQVRNVYDKIIKAQDCNGLKMIRPQLAYIAGRDKNENQKKFLAFIDSIIKTVREEEQRKSFKVFFESIVAYHKFYGNQ